MGLGLLRHEAALGLATAAGPRPSVQTGIKIAVWYSYLAASFSSFRSLAETSERRRISVNAMRTEDAGAFVIHQPGVKTAYGSNTTSSSDG